MKKPEIISYKGKQVIYLDFSYLKRKQQIGKLEKAAGELIQSQPINSALVLINIEKMYFNNELRCCFIDTARANEPFVKASAILGLYGLATFVYNDFLAQSGRRIKPHSSKTDALEYLLSIE